MMKIGEKTKLLSAIFIPLILFVALFSVFAFSGVHIFRGERSEALSILNGVVQGLSTIIAIVFAIVILVVQTTLGKYSVRATRYIVTDWINILMLFLYVCTISSALWTMWNINKGFWNVWMDVTATASFVCLGALLPFFLRMTHSLNPNMIMNEVKKEILSACKEEDFKLMSDKTNLLLSMIGRSVRGGDVMLAFGGFQILEEVIKLEDSGKNRWMFYNLMQSLLDNLGMECLEKNPNVTLRTFDAYSRILDKLKRAAPPIFVNVASRVERFVVEICANALSTRFAEALLSKAYWMMIDIYKTNVLLDYYFVCLWHVDQSLREILKMSRDAGIFETYPFWETNHAVMELLKEGKDEEALHLSEVIFSELTGAPSVKLFIMGLILDSKVAGFDDFASGSLGLAKPKFGSFNVDVVYDANFGEGRREMSVKPDGSLEIKIGDKGKEEACLWIKQEISKIN